MSTDSVTSVLSSTTETTTSATGFDDLTSEDFFSILITELQQQDPLNPTETADMLSQLSDIRNIEVSKQLTDSLSQLADSQNMAGTGEMLGKFISATVTNSEGSEYTVAGVITAVHYDTNGQQVFELDTGDVVPAANVNYVTTEETADALLAALAAENEDEESKSETSKQQTTTTLPTWLTVEGWLPSWLTG